MTKYELLEKESYENGVEIIQHTFNSNRIKGLYSDSVIALNKDLSTSAEKACVLAEELGHYYTTTGNILEQSDTMNRKQEYRARLVAYNKMIGLCGIIDAYKRGCRNRYEIADYLGVPEEFLLETLNAYKSKYGLCTTVDNYIVYFEPLGVLEICK